MGVVVFSAFLLLTIAWTWPVAASLSSRITPDPGDPLLNTWILWWSTQEIPFTEAWWNAPFFYPMPGALALSEHLAGLAVFSAPVMLLGASPVAAYNVTLLLTYALSGFFSYLLVRRLTGSTVAALVAGVAFAFAPYRAGQLPHIQVLASHWMPLLLLAMHVFVETGRRRWLALAAACWVLQALSNGYYLLFLPVLVASWMAWFVDWRRSPRRGLELLGAFALSSVLLLPAVLKYVEVHGARGLARAPPEMRGYSPSFASFLRPPHLLAFWPDVWDTAEGHLFPGVTPIALVTTAVALLAFRRRSRHSTGRRAPLLFYCLATVFLWLLAMGPAEADAGWRAVLHPYSALAPLPGFSGLRVPARFAMLATLCLTTAAGLAFARLAPRGRVAAGLGALAFAGVVADGWLQPLPMNAPPGRIMLPDIPDLAVLELPPLEPTVGAGAMYRAIHHRRPLLTGYSGYFPPHIHALADALGRQDPTALPALARGRPVLVVIDDDFDPAHDLRELAERAPGSTLHGGTGAGIAYLLPPQPRERIAPLGTRWDAAVTLQPREHVVFDLGAPRVVRALEFPVRDRYRELAGRVAVEASDDGVTWTTVWEDWTGGLAVTALLNDERLGLVRFAIPDVRTRYVRVHPAPEWMWKELGIYGPR